MRRMVVAAVVLGFSSWLISSCPAAISAGVSAGFTACSEDKDEKDKTPPKEPAKELVKEPEKKKPKVEPVPPPAAQQYYERVITCYKIQYTEREVKELVTNLVPRQEKFTCTVYKPVVKPVKRLEIYYVPEEKPVSYTRTVLDTVTTKEKRIVKECKLVYEDVPFKFIELVPTPGKATRTVCYTELQTKMVEVTVPMCQLVQVQGMDCCGNCIQFCQPILVPQKVKREVCLPVMKTKEVVCDVIVGVPKERSGMKTVCKPVYTDKEIWVDVTRCVPRSEKVTGTTCVLVPKTREVTCQVETCEPVQQTGFRTVFDCQSVWVTRKVQCAELVPYVQRIPVIVGPCCPCW